MDSRHFDAGDPRGHQKSTNPSNSVFGYYRIWNKTLRMYPAAHKDPQAEYNVHRYKGYKLLADELDKNPKELPDSEDDDDDWKPS